MLRQTLTVQFRVTRKEDSLASLVCKNSLESRPLASRKIRLPVEAPSNTRYNAERQMFRSLARGDFAKWEAQLQDFKASGFEPDSVTLSIATHGYIISKRHMSSTALLVTSDAMEHSRNYHPIIQQLNSSLVESYFKLADVGIRPSSQSWIGMLRFVIGCSERLRKRTAQKLVPVPQALKI